MCVYVCVCVSLYRIHAASSLMQHSRLCSMLSSALCTGSLGNARHIVSKHGVVGFVVEGGERKRGRDRETTGHEPLRAAQTVVPGNRVVRPTLLTTVGHRGLLEGLVT